MNLNIHNINESIQKRAVFFISPERKLIIEYYSGYIYLSDILKIKSNAGEHKDFSKDFNVLIDFRDAELKINVNELLNLFQFAKENPQLIGNRREAYLTSNPEQVVLGTLFEKYKQDLPIESNIFSTLGAGILWISALNNFTWIENTIEKLKSENGNSSDKK